MLPKDNDSLAPYSTLPARLTIKRRAIPIPAKTYIRFCIFLICLKTYIMIRDTIRETIANTNCLTALP